MSDAVLYRREGLVGVITLNQPDDRNTMTPALLDGLAEVTATVRADPEVRAVVLTAEGSCFSAGANLKVGIQRELPGRPRPPVERSYAMYTAFLSVLDIEVPVIGALQGHAIGGGFGLALVTDIRIASERAKYGANFVKLGIHPGMAITYLLPRLIGPQVAAELLYTGRIFRGDEGAAMGLFLRAVAAEEVLPQSLALAQSIAANAPAALRLTKRSIVDGLGWRTKDAAFREAYVQAMTLEMADSKEGLAAALEKRSPEFTGG